MRKVTDSQNGIKSRMNKTSQLVSVLGDMCSLIPKRLNVFFIDGAQKVLY